IVAALSSVRAKAVVTTARIGRTDHATLAMRVGAALFSIRHVCAFGKALPDGVVPLDDIFEARGNTPTLGPHEGNPAAHAAVITFEPTPRGVQPVTRKHSHLIAGGCSVASTSGLGVASTLLSAMPISSFAALGTLIVPWLVGGGRLVLHQPFDVDAFVSRAGSHDLIALP